MKPHLRALLPRRTSVVRSDRGLIVAAAAHGAVQQVRVAWSRNGTTLWEGVARQGTDTTSRVPADAWIASIPATHMAPGTYTLTWECGGSTGVSTDTVEVAVFTPLQQTWDVASDQELHNALTAIANTTRTHVRIRFAFGMYTMPADVDLRHRDDVLIQLQGPAVVTDSAVLLRRFVATDMSFLTYSSDQTVLDLDDTVTASLVRCSLTGQGGGSGIRVAPGGAVQFVDGFARLLDVAWSGVDVVRGAWWMNVGSRVFDDPGRLVEGVTGYGPCADAWMVLNANTSSVLVRSNMALDLTSPVLTMRAGAFRGALLGNVLLTYDSRGLVFRGLDGALVERNSIVTAEGSEQTLVVANARDTAVVGNYLTGIERRVVQALGSEFRLNATATPSWSTTNLGNVSQPFATKYLVPDLGSALLDRGVETEGLPHAFGELTHAGQIGALPRHPDTNLDSVLSSVVKSPRYSLDLHTSPDGDFLAAEAPAGQANFRDGTQSGLLGVM